MIIDDYVTPAQLTSYVREVPSPNNLILERFLPDRPIQHIEAMMDQVTRTNRAAKFRSWDTETSIGKRDTFESRRVKLPPLGQKLPVGEYEALQLELARTGGNNRGAIIEAIYNDVDNNVRSIYNRMELARGDVFMDGKFTLRENGLILEADFGLDPSHLVAPAGALWSDTVNALPITDMRGWIQTYVKDTGERPGYAVMPEAIISNLTLNKQVREAGASDMGGTFLPPFVTEEQLSRIMSVNRLPQIVPYDTMIDVDDVTQRVIAEKNVIFLPADPSSLGYTAWGITAEALLLTQGQNPSLTFQQTPGLVGVTMREGDPPRLWSKVGAVGMPILTDTRRLMTATVLA